MKLEFKFLKNNSIFHDRFDDLVSLGRQTIEFKKQPYAAGGISVIYAPNGTEKSTFTHTVGAKNSLTRYLLRLDLIMAHGSILQIKSFILSKTKLIDISYQVRLPIT